MALAVWYGKSPSKPEHDVLALFAHHPGDGITPYEQKFPLRWLSGSTDPPFVNIWTTSVRYFQTMIRSEPAAAEKYRLDSEILYFDKKLLSEEILQFFDVITEASGLVKGWYLAPVKWQLVIAGSRSLESWYKAKHEIGIVKVWEADDFQHCRALVHVEVNQKWLPLSQGALTTYTFYHDLQAQQPGKFLFEGGSLYDLLKIEVRTDHEYSSKVRETLGDSSFALPDDRYVEVYLRAEHPPKQPAA